MRAELPTCGAVDLDTYWKNRQESVSAANASQRRMVSWLLDYYDPSDSGHEAVFVFGSCGSCRRLADLLEISPAGAHKRLRRGASELRDNVTRAGFKIVEVVPVRGTAS